MSPELKRFSDELDALTTRAFSLPSSDAVGLLVGAAFVVAIKGGKTPSDVAEVARRGAAELGPRGQPKPPFPGQQG